MCCVRAGHVVAGVAARRHMIRPEERVLIIPVVVVDRSNNSTSYIVAFCAVVGVFIILGVLGLQKQIGSKPFLCATLRQNSMQQELLCMGNVYNFVG